MPTPTVRPQTFESSAISNILPGRYWGDVYGGVEFKRLERSTLFIGVPVADGSAELFQLVLGWSGNFQDRWGKTAVDVRLKANPGGVLHGNDARRFPTAGSMISAMLMSPWT